MGLFAKLILCIILLLGSLYLIGKMSEPPTDEKKSSFLDKPYFYDDYYMGLYDNEQYQKPEFIFPVSPDNMYSYAKYAKLAQ